MTMKELAAEYDKTVLVVSGRIRERRERLKTAVPFTKEARRIEDELSVLYRERRDALDIAHILRNYYGEVLNG